MNRRLLAILALSICPWSVAFAGVATFVFPFALVDPNTGAVTTIDAYYFRQTTTLPAFLRAWGIGVVLYVLAVASAAAGVLFDREDRRVTAGLLVVAGFTQLSLAYGFSRQPGRFAIPLGTVLCLAVVWWFDADTLAGGWLSSE